MMLMNGLTLSLAIDTLKVGVVARLHPGYHVADFLTDGVQFSLVQPLLGLDVSPHRVSRLVQIVKVLQLTKLLSKNFKLFETPLQLKLVLLKALYRYNHA